MLDGIEPSEIVRYGALVDVQHGGELLAIDLPVAGGQLEVNSESAVPELLTLDVTPEQEHLFIADGRRVHLKIICESFTRREVIDRGWYRILPGSTGSSVRAAGLLDLVRMAPWPFASSPRMDATLHSELERLAAPLPVVLDAGVVNVPVPSSLAWGFDRLKAIGDLCASVGLTARVKADGYLHVCRVPRLTGVPVALYEAGSTLLDLQQGASAERHNRFVFWARGKLADGNADVNLADARGDISRAQKDLGDKTAQAAEKAKALDDALRKLAAASGDDKRSAQSDVDRAKDDKGKADQERAQAQQKLSHARDVARDAENFLRGQNVDTGSGASGFVVATVDISEGETGIRSYGLSVLSRELEAGTSYAKCLQAAKAAAEAEMMGAGELTAETITDPRVELDDIIGLLGHGQARAMRVTKFSIPLRHDRTMRIDGREMK